MSCVNVAFTRPTLSHPDDMGVNMERKLTAEYPSA